MDAKENEGCDNMGGLNKYLSPLGAWALAFGCSVGWGAFVMPGNTFLPIAGPIGTFIGMIVGGLIMLVIGINYHYLINMYPDCGGSFSYTKHELGYDHAFLSSWFLILVYIAIVWANATAIPLICRNLFGSMLQFGFHYSFAGFDVYFGEVAVSMAAIMIAGLLCAYGGKYSVWVQTVMAFVLLGGIIAGAAAIHYKSGQSLFAVKPGFAPGDKPVQQVFQIVVLAPWAFAGFESISHSAEEFKFSTGKSLKVIIAAIITSIAAYGLLALIAVTALPKGYSDWYAYVSDIGILSGYEGLPTFYAMHTYLGQKGMVILGLAVSAGIMTGLVGNMIAASRLLYALARDDMLPDLFRKINKNHAPINTIWFIIIISIFVPTLGRAAIGWIVDVNTIGATIAYAYTSIVAYRAATREKKTVVRVCGFLGMIFSLAFTIYFLIPNIWSVSVLSPQSYFILIIWSMLGFAFFYFVFKRDKERRFGQSTFVWIMLLFMIFFVTMLWFREASQKTSEKVLESLNEYNERELEEHGIELDDIEREDSEYYLDKQMNVVDRALQENSMIQMTIILLALFIMFAIYNSMMEREKDMEVEKESAERSSIAKTTFLSNMSHDIRTPMNAIIGYTELARDVEDDPELIGDYLNKIESSSKHLLALINDILDMSRIESGKMELEVSDNDLIRVAEDVKQLFETQMKLKNIEYTLDTKGIINRYVKCDANRLNRVILNLISNAYKFTEDGGKVEIIVDQTEVKGGRGFYEFRVRDTGMGMSREFAETVFEAYSRERNDDEIQGTGLGMAITKNIVELMDGEIHVNTELNKGTEFVVRVAFEITEAPEEDVSDRRNKFDNKRDYTGMRILLVEDQVVNREIATMILQKFGFGLDYASNGQEAVDKVASAKPGDYKVILMDIQMPVMNGYEAAAAIRKLPDKELSGIPIIAMTANAFSEDVGTAMEAGMNAHVPKPIDVDHLMSTLDKVLYG